MMRLADLPTEILLQIFQKVDRPIDIYSVKMMNERFFKIVERYKLATASVLQIKDIYVEDWEYPRRLNRNTHVEYTENVCRLNYIEISADVEHDGKLKHKTLSRLMNEKDTATILEQALLKLNIGAAEVLILNSSAVEHLAYVFDRIGFNTRKITSVRRTGSINDETEPNGSVYFPFMNDEWLINLYKQKREPISLEGASTHITMKGIIEILKNVAHTQFRAEENHHFGTIDMTPSDHKSVEQLFLNSDLDLKGSLTTWTGQETYRILYKNVNLRWYFTNQLEGK